MSHEQVPDIPESADELIDRIDSAKAHKRRSSIMNEAVPLVFGVGPFAALGVLLTSGHETSSQANHAIHNRPASIEKSGNHHGTTQSTRPGTGTLHTKNGDFHLTQTYGLGTAVTAESNDGGPTVEHVVNP